MSETAKKFNPFDDLPDEVSNLVLNYLNVNSLINLCTVNSAMRVRLGPMWLNRDLFERNFFPVLKNDMLRSLKKIAAPYVDEYKILKKAYEKYERLARMPMPYPGVYLPPFEHEKRYDVTLKKVNAFNEHIELITNCQSMDELWSNLDELTNDDTIASHRVESCFTCFFKPNSQKQVETLRKNYKDFYKKLPERAMLKNILQAVTKNNEEQDDLEQNDSEKQPLIPK